ncbi:ceramide synthase 4 [Cricetulus griseus]|uniref:Ceramide synthase 4 n=1 Tax=Cricetulus griseus TaxID=10029 RepID=A0A9J7K553_CRIGR|nr:ceramide synthase 4 [Cricetulus griseus]XP_035314116.1 ceramide synthase 4 [Cricetulus griseus]
MLSSLSEWLWQERYWLPPNSTWAQLEDRDGLVFAHPHHMLAALPMALVLLAVRIIFERFVALPLSRWMGIKDQIRRQMTPNPVLEKYFLRMGQRPVETQMVLLAAQCGLTLRQTQRWFRRRRNQQRPCLSKKFCEASWRFVFYQCSFVGGISILYHEPWFWTVALCWEDYPQQTLNLALYWWYLVELGFYISLLITLPFDIKRKDFKEQVVHHFVAMGLIAFSYSSNLLRIGSVVLMVHDSSDYLLEACKMFNYTHFRRVSNTLFIIFSLVFFYTRLICFPTQVIYSTLFDSIKNSGPFFGYYYFNMLLLVLLILNVYWFCLIMRMIFGFLRKGQMGKDIRSDAEESDSSDDGAVPEGPQLKNRMAPGSGPAIANGPRSRAAGRLANGHTQAA